MMSINSLPAPALQAVIEHFCNPSGLGSAERFAAAATARLTCKRWSDVSCAAIDAVAPKHAAGLVDACQRFKTLRAVDLRYIKSIDASAAASFSQLHSLCRLSIAGTTGWDTVRGAVLQTITTSCTALTHLDISAVDDQLAGLIARLTQLRCLSLAGKLSDEGLQHMSQLTRLQELTISCCDTISDASLEVLTHFPELGSVQLHSCLQLGDAALTLLGHLTQLTALSLSHSCEDATGAGLMCISSLKNLQHLNLSAASEGAAPAALAQLLSSLQQLTLLDLSYCEHVGPPVLRAIAELQHLQVLGISGMNCSSLHCLHYLTSLSNLQQLQMRWIGQLKDAHAAFLPHLAALTTLDLSYCRSLTGEGLQQLQWLTQLKVLNLTAVGSDDLCCLSALQQLTGLTVSQLAPTSRAWKHIAGLHQLRVLALLRCCITTGGGSDGRLSSMTCTATSETNCSNDSSSCVDVTAVNESSDGGGKREIGARSCKEEVLSRGSSSSSSAAAESNVGCLAQLQQLAALDCSGSALQVAALSMLQQLPQLQYCGLSRCQNVSNAVLSVLGGCSSLRKLDLRLRGSGSSWNLRGLLGLLQQSPGLSAVYVTEAPAGLPKWEICRVVACSSAQVVLPVGTDAADRLGFAP